MNFEIEDRKKEVNAIRSDKYLNKICMEIYRKMYKETLPQVLKENEISDND